MILTQLNRLRQAQIPVGVTNGLLTGLVSYWELGEATGTRVDSHGTNDLSSVNAVTNTTGIIGNGANFNAADQILSRSGGITLGNGNTEASLSVWFKLSVTGADKAIWSSYDGADDQYSPFFVQYDVDFAGRANCINAQVDCGTNIYTVASDASSITDTNWHHVLVTAKVGDALKLFLDGVEVSDGGTSLVGQTALQTPSGSAETYVGQLRTSNKRTFTGVIDEIGLWNVDKSSSASDIYNSGAGFPYNSFD
jgi:hypothetical protein